jgi:type II secretion system protein J
MDDGALRHGARRGFTLLEVLVALCILAVVFSALYGTYSGTVESCERVEAAREREQAGRLALMHITDDLKSVYYRPFQGDEEFSPYRFQGGTGAAIVAFAATASLGFPGAFPSLAVNRIGYLLEPQPNGEPGYRLLRQETPFADLPGQGTERRVEVADRVQALSLTYADAEGEWVSTWDSASDETADPLPRLVAVRLLMRAEESEPVLFTTVLSLRPAPEEAGQRK